MHENLEQGRQGDASRTTHLNDEQEAEFYDLLDEYRKKGADGWSTLAPCSTVAKNAWERASGENLSPYGPYSNPSTLKESIIEANGGEKNGVK